jgi:hypothetical protein
LSVLGLFLPSQLMAKTMGASVEDKHSNFYDAFLVLLDPYAGKAIKKNIQIVTMGYGMQKFQR